MEIKEHYFEFLQGEHDKRRTSEKIADDQLFASAPFDRPSNGLRNMEQPKKYPNMSTLVLQRCSQLKNPETLERKTISSPDSSTQQEKMKEKLCSLHPCPTCCALQEERADAGDWQQAEVGAVMVAAAGKTAPATSTIPHLCLQRKGSSGDKHLLLLFFVCAGYFAGR
uniref:Uncharacterized protein n=2 Tax=Aegilops tauschii subsp. strangulata TaxID=200361 RepID=A0A453GEN7_AEGTS